MTTIRDRRTAGALRRALTCGILLALAGTALAACAADSADPATGAPSARVSVRAIRGEVVRMA